MEILYHQKEYARHLRPISLNRDRFRNKESFATEKEVAALRAINGEAIWLSSEQARYLCTDIFLPAVFSKVKGQRPLVCSPVST